MARSLSLREAAALRRADFTYDEIGATAAAPSPNYRHYYRHLGRTRTLPDADFDQAAARLMTWQAHEGAGLRVAASSQRAEPGAVILMRLGIGPLGVRIPCRVIYVIDEPNRIGFAYGTLPGHPVAGEELFLVQRDHLGRVTFTVNAFFKPATMLACVGGPVARWVQGRLMDRYPRALNRP